MEPVGPQGHEMVPVEKVVYLRSTCGEWYNCPLTGAFMLYTNCMDSQPEDLEIADFDSNGDRLVDEMWGGPELDDEDVDLVLEDDFSDDSYE